MRKIFVLLCLFFLVCGCSDNSSKSIITNLNKNIMKGSGYSLNGSLELLNNDEVYNYDVIVDYKKDNYYKVSLTNKSNNHTQIILKNDDGVFILTPSLNKSFKFQSDWPYSNSQVYLLDTLVKDLCSEDVIFNAIDDGYEFVTKVNYPNNKNLVKQKIFVDKKNNIKSVKIYDSSDLVCMKMIFDEIKYSPKFDDDHFEIDSIMSNYIVEDNKEVSLLEDVLYPLVIPKGTKLSSEERINTDTGERVILTFDGDKSFLLVEETVAPLDEFTIIPTYGEPFQLMDTLGVMTDTSLSWISNGVEYYLISDVMSNDELIEVAQSIYSVPTVSIK